MDHRWPKSVQRQRLKDVRNNVCAAVSEGRVVEYEACPVETARYKGLWGDFLYQIEGEEDLLHLIVERCDGSSLTVEDAQGVADQVLAGVPTGLIRLTPGVRSHHFYVGHEEFVRSDLADRQGH